MEQGCSLLLDDRDKVRRLISHGMPTSRAAHDLATSPLLGSGAQADSVASTRFPVVTFPQLKAPASRGIVIPPLRLQVRQCVVYGKETRAERGGSSWGQT